MILHTRYGRTRDGRSVLLDRLESVTSSQDWSEGNCFFEGIPSGSEEEIRLFLEEMDQILWLQVPFGTRLQRMIDRDGPAALGRFLYNEFAWNRYLVPLLEGNRRVRRVSPLQIAKGEAIRD